MTIDNISNEMVVDMRIPMKAFNVHSFGKTCSQYIAVHVVSSCGGLNIDLSVPVNIVAVADVPKYFPPKFPANWNPTVAPLVHVELPKTDAYYGEAQPTASEFPGLTVVLPAT